MAYDLIGISMDALMCWLPC